MQPANASHGHSAGLLQHLFRRCRYVVAASVLGSTLAMQTEAAACPDTLPQSLPYAEAALPLSEGAGTGSEIWECMGSNLVARNVTRPTLTPVLPAQGEGVGTAVIVAPGGGFEMLSMTQEGFAVAEWLAERGITAFVLKYRLNETPESVEEWRRSNEEKIRKLRDGSDDTPRLPTPAEADAAAAVRLVRARAGEWSVDPERVGILGFSAGAMIAIAAGDLEDAGARPDFIAPIYPPLWSREIPNYAPQAFLAIALDDRLFTAGGRPLDLINDMQASGRPFEAHLYQSGGHGFGMAGNGAATALWADEFYAWLEDRSLLFPGYSVKSTPIAELLRDSAARAVLDKYLPGLADNPQTLLAGSLSLEKLRGYAPQMISEESLQNIQTGFDAL